MKFFNHSDHYEQITVADLKVGDKVLTRYYDENNEYVETDFQVESISSRRYGNGMRYLVKWQGDPTIESYKPDKVFARGLNSNFAPDLTSSHI